MLFGSGVHQYPPDAPPLAPSVVEAFEERHRASLPQDYRCFITEIGDGGAGPYDGVLLFGEQDDDRIVPGKPAAGRRTSRKPFPHVAAWNPPESFWQGEPDPPPGTPSEEEDRLWEAWDEVLEGVTGTRSDERCDPICHRCACGRGW